MVNTVARGFDTPQVSTLQGRHVMLCADSTSLGAPEMLGLKGVRLDTIEWLTLSACGVEARQLLRAGAELYAEVWVASADDIDGINLAAALVVDHPSMPVYLICGRQSGSLMSRAQSAGIRATLTPPMFRQRFERVAASLAVEAPFAHPSNVATTASPLASGFAAGAPEPSLGASHAPTANPLGAPVDEAANFPMDAASSFGRPTSSVDPDPFAAEEPLGGGVDQACRLSIERLRSIALTPDTDAPDAGDKLDADFVGAGLASSPDSVMKTVAPPAVDATTLLPLPTVDQSVQAPVEIRSPRQKSAKASDTGPAPTCVQTALRPQVKKKRERPGRQNGFLISVLSGGGGAGKSTVSALVAARIARQGLRVALLDCDLQFGDMAAFFGVRQAVTVDRVLEEGVKALSETSGDGKPFVIAAPGNVEQSEAVDVERLLELVLPKFDVVVANTGAGWGDVQAYLMENSTRVLFVVDQRASSVRACLHGLDLCRRCGIASNSFLFVLNRCSKSAPFTSIDLSCALKGATVAELREGGLEVEELLGSGMAVELAASNNPVVDSIATMLGKLLPDSLAALAESRRSDDAPPRSSRRKKSSRFRRKRGDDFGEVMMTR